MRNYLKYQLPINMSKKNKYFNCLINKKVFHKEIYHIKYKFQRIEKMKY